MAADRRLVSSVEAHAELVLDEAQRRGGRDQERLPFTDDEVRGLGVELVFDLPHQFLDHVLDRHEADHGTVLIRDQGELLLLCAQAPQDLV